MNLEKYRSKLVGSNDERAVSPVIGVILMVAITVILAAVIAAFVLDMGDVSETAPNAQYEWDSGEEEVTWSHQSGEDISVDTLKMSITAGIDDGTSVTSEKILMELAGDGFTAGNDITLKYDGDDASSTEITVSGSSLDSDTVFDFTTISSVDDADDIDSVEKVTVTWESDGSSSVISDYEP